MAESSTNLPPMPFGMTPSDSEIIFKTGQVPFAAEHSLSLDTYILGRDAYTGELELDLYMHDNPKTLMQERVDFTAEYAPGDGHKIVIAREDSYRLGKLPKINLHILDDQPVEGVIKGLLVAVADRKISAIDIAVQDSFPEQKKRRNRMRVGAGLAFLALIPTIKYGIGVFHETGVPGNPSKNGSLALASIAGVFFPSVYALGKLQSYKFTEKTVRDLRQRASSLRRIKDEAVNYGVTIVGQETD